jgi:DNA polymerase-1
MRLAMIRLEKRLNVEKNQNTKMLLQIHDELIFETPKEEAKRISKIIIEEMTSVANSDQHSFSIPLTVDLNSGDNWGTLH